MLEVWRIENDWDNPVVYSTYEKAKERYDKLAIDNLCYDLESQSLEDLGYKNLTEAVHDYQYNIDIYNEYDEVYSISKYYVD